MALGLEGPVALEGLRHELSRSSQVAEAARQRDSEEWAEIELEYGASYPVVSPPDLLRSLAVDFYTLQGAIRLCRDELTRQRLQRTAALLSAFMAQTVSNLGRVRESKRWRRTARWSAEESRDPFASMWVRHCEIIRAGHEKRPLTSVVQLVEQAESLVPVTPPEALPGFYAAKAQTLFLAGRPALERTEGALDQLRRAQEGMPDLPWSDGTAFSFGQERVFYVESFCYSHLGEYGRASAAQDRALRLYPDSDARGPAQIELQRALCLVREGDSREGLRHACKVITELPATDRIQPVAGLGWEVMSAVPRADRARSGTLDDFSECFQDAFGAHVPSLRARGLR